MLQNLDVFKQVHNFSTYRYRNSKKKASGKFDKVLTIDRAVELLNRSRIHERPISLRLLGIILRVLRLEVSVWIS